MRTFTYDDKKRTRFSQQFEKETFIKQGKEIKIYDLIQNSNVDTEIYPTLKKYGCIEYLKMDKEKTYGDLTAIKGLRDAIEIAQQGEKLFMGLPADIKSEFHNDPKEFINNGEKWLKDKIDAEKPKTVEPTTTEGATTNE